MDRDPSRPWVVGVLARVRKNLAVDEILRLFAELDGVAVELRCPRCLEGHDEVRWEAGLLDPFLLQLLPVPICHADAVPCLQAFTRTSSFSTPSHHVLAARTQIQGRGWGNHVPEVQERKNTAGESPRQERKAYLPTGSRTQGHKRTILHPHDFPRHPSHTTHKWFHRFPTRPGKPNANSPDLPQPPPNCENLLRRRPRGPCPSTRYSGPPP
jgi:hypothetical protein